MTKNAYIHIPFCKSKCFYCSFVSFASVKNKDDYIKALIKQIKTEYKGEVLKTIYFGGGTPSLLSIGELKSIIELFNYEKNAEITIEANPDGVNFEYLNKLKDFGFNRISFGSQTFDDEMLKKIGRTHNSKQITEAVDAARRAAFGNISLDLIYGLPEQKIEDFSKDLNKILELGVEHISLYGLKIEDGCVFSRKMPDNIPSPDMQADMILMAVKKLKTAGFEHYEVSNFAKKGFQSRHNLNYWDNNSYFGFGLAASGYENGIRYKSTVSMKKYIENPLLKDTSEILTASEQLEEEIFLGLRKLNGINYIRINEKFKIDFEEKYKKIIQKYQKYLIKDNDFYKLTEQGILISNEIMSEFIEV